jgi:pre-mRNA cleavage complex 2 protein Pcf11
VNNTCPICQEKFEMKWLDEAQEWVWTDAVKVGDRVYHGSCHREAAGSMQHRPTPEMVLGKRKAEVSFLSVFFFPLTRKDSLTCLV